MDDLVALEAVDGEGPNLADNPPGKHPEEEGADEDGHKKGAATALGLDTTGFLNSNAASESSDQRDTEEDNLRDTTYQEPSINGLLARRIIRVVSLGTVDGEGHNEPDAHRQSNDGLHDSTANLEASFTTKTYHFNQNNHLLVFYSPFAHPQGLKSNRSRRATPLFRKSPSHASNPHDHSVFPPLLIYHPLNSSYTFVFRLRTILIVQLFSRSSLQTVFLRFLRLRPLKKSPVPRKLLR